VKIEYKHPCPLCKRECVCYRFTQTAEQDLWVSLFFKCERCRVLFSVTAKGFTVEGKEIIFGEIIGVDTIEWNKGCHPGNQSFNPSSREED